MKRCCRFNELEQLENPESRRKQPAWLPVQFDPEVTEVRKREGFKIIGVIIIALCFLIHLFDFEEEKTRGLMEALCQVVGKQVR